MRTPMRRGKSGNPNDPERPVESGDPAGSSGVGGAEEREGADASGELDDPDDLYGLSDSVLEAARLSAGNARLARAFGDEATARVHQERAHNLLGCVRRLRARARGRGRGPREGG